MSLSDKSDSKGNPRTSEVEINLRPSGEQSFFEKTAVQKDQIQIQLPELEEAINR
ncbi:MULTISPECIES: hypothetical protein [Legionella]|uniref:Uncharacterized protein n=1 Tax=Legionella drozanskii LLAP-1 TaxID=1212489 RepID=A0A0W0SRG9_9GAMM|nr:MULTISPECIES: hypothetical protein [Legionella]KTC85820.1 hypothetical protein Ldro_2145 [Legionella drozanskii LLAP-1]